MIRQLLVSLVIVGAAAAAYIFFVPGAPQTLARFGIELPFAPQAEAASTPAGQTPQSSGQQAAAGSAKSAPLSKALQDKAKAAVDSIKAKA